MNLFYNPVHTIQSEGAVNEIPRIINEISSETKNILLIIWNENVLETEVFKNLVKSEEYKVKSICFNESNPTVEQLFNIYSQTKSFSPNVIIAVGGGSVMDVGKSLCCIYGNDISTVDELRNIISQKKYKTPVSKWIGVPTTAGTGSEVTCWATIWDPKKGVKMSVESQKNYAYAAVVDPNLTDGMPISLAVSSALDAVAHAVESYWANGSNVVSKGIALYAIRTIMSHIDELIKGDKKAHIYMSQGSLMAGMAFSNTKTTACHSISYPLTMKYHIPHGTAVSMLLAPVFEINQAKTENSALLLEALGVKNVNELSQRIHGILKSANIPSSLEEWNVDYNDISYLAERGITKGRADNNPVNITTDTIEDILKSIYKA